MNEEKCIGCPYAEKWSGPYSGAGAYPACSHPKSGPRTVNLLSDMNRCPKDNNPF